MTDDDQPIDTRELIAKVEEIADEVNAGLQAAMPCYCVEQCGRKRCGECGQ